MSNAIDNEIQQIANEMLQDLNQDNSNSSLFAIEDGSESKKAKEHLRNNLGLKVGIVVKVHEIGDKTNISKITPEYDVIVLEQNKTDPSCDTRYRNCVTADVFGSRADFLDIKYRINEKEDFDGSIKKQKGSMVLIMCIDGNGFDAIILGAVKHPARKTTLTKDKGHHLEGEFNGVNWKIDKDGALTVTFKSATDNDAKPKDTKAGGSYYKMEKDGSIEAGDGNKEKIRIDKTKKTISMTAESDISATTDANASITAKSNINLKATASILADAGGSATFKSGGAFNINAGGAFSVKAPSVMINSDGSATIKGSMVSLSAPSVMVGNGGTPAVTLSTQFMGIGNLGAPVISVAIGPFSGSVFIGA
jgi:hypothetical protein